MNLLLSLLLACAPKAPLAPPVAGAPRPVPVQAMAHYLGGEIALARGDLDGASDQYEQALLFDPGSPWIKLAFANLALRKGDLDGATDFLRGAVEGDPGLTQGWLGLARVLRLQGDPEGAVEAYRHAVDTGGGWHARAGLVDVLSQQRQRDQAVEALDAWLAMPVTDRYDLAERGGRLARLGRPSQAVDRLAEALESMPHNQAVIDAFLAAAQQSRRYGTAIETLAHLRQIEPTAPILLKRQARLCLDVGDWWCALDALQTLDAQAEQPDPARTLAIVAVLLTLDRPQQALDRVQTLAEPVPGRAEALAQTFLALDRPTQALQALGPSAVDETLTRLDLRIQALDALSRDDDATGLLQARLGEPAVGLLAQRRLLQAGALDAAVALHQRLGTPGALDWAAMLRESGHADLALQVLDALDATDPHVRSARAAALIALDRASEAVALLEPLAATSSNQRYRYAWALERAGRHTQARAVLTAMVDEGLDYAPALNDVAYTLATEGGDLDRALALSRRAVDIMPSNASYRDTLGWVLYLRGQPVAALEQLEWAARALPDQPEIHAHLAQVRAGMVEAP